MYISVSGDYGDTGAQAAEYAAIPDCETSDMVNLGEPPPCRTREHSPVEAVCRLTIDIALQSI